MTIRAELFIECFFFFFDLFKCTVLQAMCHRLHSINEVPEVLRVGQIDTHGRYSKFAQTGCLKTTGIDFLSQV